MLQKSQGLFDLMFEKKSERRTRFLISGFEYYDSILYNIIVEYFITKKYYTADKCI